jgi:ribose 5-phosphate isomerase A
MNMKERVAEAIAGRVVSGEVLGIGTGSTVDLAVRRIGQRIKDEGLQISAITTSLESTIECERAGIQVLTPHYSGNLSWGFDGADEYDAQLRVIKGKGAALFYEKLIAVRCPRLVIIVDESKRVARLGERMPVPVEVALPAISYVEKQLQKLGARTVTLRQATGKHGAVITESGNVIFDVVFPEISDSLEGEIKLICGVIESGIFTNHAHEIMVATLQGIECLTR